MKSGDKDKTFVIFECCRIIIGKANSIILDLQRDKYIFISTFFANFLLENNKCKLSEILLKHNQENKEIIIKNFLYLIDNEFAFYTELAGDNFPPLSLYWNEPSKITNSIVDLTHFLENGESLVKVLKELRDLGCKVIEFRINNNTLLAKSIEIENVIQRCAELEFESLDFVLPFTNQLNDYFESSLQKENINKVILFNCGYNKVFVKKYFDLVLSSSIIPPNTNCGLIRNDLFISNIKFYTENLHHNSCLNRKISIDAEGNIKNCPSMKESFGNIRDTTISEAIQMPDFKRYWDINKDKIHVCKDCEFRYMCHDCRAYVDDPQDILSKPLKCGYNPYTGEWSEWSTNPLKQKAIDFYEMSEMVHEMNKAK